MSQKATRKSQNAAVADEKEKESPVKEMKKKIAANAEKDKQAAEKAEKAEKNEPADKNKSNEKADKNAEKSDKKVDKPDKTADKSDKKADKPDKNAEKSDKTADKPDKNADKPDKNADKSEKTAEKKPDKSEKVADKKSDKSAEKKEDKTAEKKSEPEKDESKGDKSKDKGPRAMNGHNGAANGCEAGGSDGSDAELVIEEDEAFPELAYEDSGSDAEDAPRSRTRRGQSKESKLLKLNEPVAPSDRKLRSADSPKPEPKKVDKKQDTEEEKKATKKDLETSKKDQESKSETKKADDGEKSQPIDVDEVSEKMDVEVVVVESTEGCAPRTRARVSPYSRPRLDRTHTSAMADYTGNNSTMEMDITESSAAEEPSLDESGYLRGLRGIRGRASYKPLRDIQLTRPRAPDRAAAGPARPLGAVVGRKRKPSAEAPPEPAEEADLFLAHGKRMRLLDRLAQPFRRTLARRAAEIVGINTDLPLTAPIASTSFAAFDPETLKPAPAPGAPPPAPDEPVATPLDLPADRDGKRCVIM